MVLDKLTLRKYVPFAEDGLSLIIEFNTSAAFSDSLDASNDDLPILV